MKVRSTGYEKHAGIGTTDVVATLDETATPEYKAREAMVRHIARGWRQLRAAAHAGR